MSVSLLSPVRRRVRIATLAALCSIGLPSQLYAKEELKGFERIKSIGQWEILRRIDPMTDQVECSGAYRDKEGGELSFPVVKRDGEESGYLIFSIPDIVDEFRFRIDERAATDWQPEIGINARQGLVQFAGVRFPPLLKAKRLRVELRGYWTNKLYDIQLEHLAEVLQAIRSKNCS